MHVYVVLCVMLVGISSIKYEHVEESTSLVSLYHFTVGVGKPSAVHIILSVSPTYKTLSEGCDTPSIKTCGASVVCTYTHG